MNNLYDGYDFIGIDPTKSPAAKKAIEDYIANINKVLDKINTVTEEEVRKAFMGSQSVVITEYINKIVNECKTISNFFEKFNEGLDQAIANYTAKSDSVRTSEVETMGDKEQSELTGVTPFGQ